MIREVIENFKRLLLRRKPVSKIALVSLFLIYFFDLAIMISAAFLISMALLESNSGLVGITASATDRNLLIGGLIGTYTLCQFLTTPILGDLSDSFGRRKLLLVTTLGTSAGMLLAGIALFLNNLPLLFFSRVVGGLFAGNLTVAQASISDLVSDKQRPLYMSIFASLRGVAWSISPYFSLFLSDRRRFPNLSFYGPFILFAALLFIGFLLSYFFFKPFRFFTPTVKIDLVKSFVRVTDLFRKPHVYHLITLSLIGMAGWLLYEKFLYSFLMDKFGFTPDMEAKAYALSSVSFLIGGLVAQFSFNRFGSTEKLMIAPLFLNTMALGAIVFAKDIFWLLPLLSLAGFSHGIVLSGFFSLFALRVDRKMQGKLFGVWNALFTFLSAVIPMMSHSLAKESINMPYILSSLLLLLCALYFLNWYKNRDAYA